MDIELVLLLFDADEFRFVVAIRHGRQHRIGNMPDPAQPGGFQSQFATGNIHTHTADYDRHHLALAKAQTEIINSLHYCHPPTVPYLTKGTEINTVHLHSDAKDATNGVIRKAKPVLWHGHKLQKLLVKQVVQRVRKICKGK